MKCSPIPALRYGQFSQLIHKNAARKRIPIGGGFEVTFRCNLRCVHCYASCNNGKERSELSFQEICRIFDEIADEGCLWLLLTGGEPFVRKDFLDIYTYAKQKGFIVTVFTNGTLVTNEVVECFRKWRPFNVEITLYGGTAETYEKVTQVPGSFDRCLRGIQLLLSAGLPVQLKSVIMSINQHEIKTLKEFSESHGMSFLYDPILSPRLDRSNHPCLYRISPEEVVEIDISEPERLKNWKEYFDSFCGKSPSDELYICGAGETSFFINPYGELQLCVLSRVPSYSLRRGTFHDGWHTVLGQVRTQRVRKDFPCRQCELVSLCGQCPGWSYLEHGNWDTPVEYLCRIAHLRAQAFQPDSLQTQQKGGDVDEKSGCCGKKAVQEAASSSSRTES